MTTPPKISIIVPVYKAENYLYKCVDSLLAQTFPDFEILLIDDGSPDKSGEICDEYAFKDRRIRVIHKENGGVSSARQCGIDNAQGEYTIHADPDDWAEPNMLEELYRKAKEEDADIVICDYWTHSSTEVFYEKKEPRSLVNMDLLLSDFLWGRINGALWNKLIRRICYLDAKVSIPNDIIIGEDLYVFCVLLQKQRRVSYLAKAFYHYDCFINGESIMKKKTRQGLLSHIKFADYLVNNFNSNKYFEEITFQKIMAKKYAFSSNLIRGNEFCELYKEVNDYIIRKPYRRDLLLDSMIFIAAKGKSWYVIASYSWAFCHLLWSFSKRIKLHFS